MREQQKFLPGTGMWQPEGLTEGVVLIARRRWHAPSTGFAGMHGSNCPPDNSETRGARFTRASPRAGEELIP